MVLSGKGEGSRVGSGAVGGGGGGDDDHDQCRPSLGAGDGNGKEQNCLTSLRRNNCKNLQSAATERQLPDPVEN